jgi:hypothetical protein
VLLNIVETNSLTLGFGPSVILLILYRSGTKSVLYDLVCVIKDRDKATITISKSLRPIKEACKSIKLSGVIVEHVWMNLLASQIQDILNN